MAEPEITPLDLQHASDLLGAMNKTDDPTCEEQRKSIRQAYPYMQLVAPRTGDDRPSRSEFHEVRCRDISSSGFSYLSLHRPDFDELVVGFGLPPNQIYIEASVMHTTPETIDGHSMFVVGCRYRKRMD